MDEDEMAKQARLMEEKMKAKAGVKKKPLIKKDQEKKQFDSADYFKEKDANDKKD